MYAHFYQLAENPFNLTPDPKFHYINESTREAMASILHGIKSRKGFITLIGEAGTGKTTLLKRVVDEIEGETKVVFVFNPGVSFDELLEFICNELGIDTHASRRLHLLEKLNAYLLEQLTAGRNVVVMIDEAQTLDDAVLEELRMLSNLETSKEKILQILLSGQPELEDKLRRPNLRQLRQRIAARATLRPMQPKEMGAYVETRLRSAGAERNDFFTARALKKIWQVSNGIPRVINVICDNAMMIAFAEGKRQITGPVLKEAIRDLQGEADAISPLDTVRSIADNRQVRYAVVAALILAVGVPLALSRGGDWVGEESEAVVPTLPRVPEPNRALPALPPLPTESAAAKEESVSTVPEPNAGYETPTPADDRVATGGLAPLSDPELSGLDADPALRDSVLDSIRRAQMLARSTAARLYDATRGEPEDGDSPNILAAARSEMAATTQGSSLAAAAAARRGAAALAAEREADTAAREVEGVPGLDEIDAAPFRNGIDAAAAEAAARANVARLEREAEAARLAETQRLADVESAGEAARLAEAERVAEAERAAEVARLAEVERAAQAERAAEAVRLAAAERVAEANRVAETKRLAEAQRLADAERAAETARKAEAARKAETARKAEAARKAETARKQAETALATELKAKRASADREAAAREQALAASDAAAEVAIAARAAAAAAREASSAAAAAAYALADAKSRAVPAPDAFAQTGESPDRGRGGRDDTAVSGGADAAGVESALDNAGEPGATTVAAPSEPAIAVEFPAASARVRADEPIAVVGRPVRIRALGPAEGEPLIGHLVRVESGDTLWDIAVQQYGDAGPSTFERIQASNPQAGDAKRLEVGTFIYMPFQNPDRMISRDGDDSFRVLLSAAPTPKDVERARAWIRSILGDVALGTATVSGEHPIYELYAVSLPSHAKAFDLAVRVLSEYGRVRGGVRRTASR